MLIEKSAIYNKILIKMSSRGEREKAQSQVCLSWKDRLNSTQTENRVYGRSTVRAPHPESKGKKT